MTAVLSAPPRSLRGGILAAAAVAVTLLVPLSLWLGTPLPLVGVVGVAVLVGAFRNPRFAAVVALLTWAGPFATQAWGRRVGGMTIDVGDLLVVAGVLGHMYRCRRAGRPVVRDPRGWFMMPIAVYLLVVLYGVLRGIAQGNALGTGADAFLSLSALSMYPLLRIAYADRPRTFVRDIVGVCIAGCVALMVAGVTGRAEDLGVVVDSFYTGGTKDTALRLDAPVQRLSVLAIFFLTVGLWPVRRPTWKHKVALLAPLVIGLGMTMTRSTWLPVIAVAIVLPALLLNGTAMVLTVARRGAVTLASLVVGLVLASSGLLGGYAASIAARFASVGDQDVLHDDSLQQRLVEVAMATRRIAEEPVLGIGFPRSYGAFIPYFPEHLNVQVFYPRDFIHNSYLGVLMFFGLPGLFAFAVLVTAVLVLARRTATSPAGVRPMPLAILGTFAVFAATSSFQTQLGYEPFYLVVATLCAGADMWWNGRTPSRFR